MFEFEKEAGDLSDYTLVLPAVSVGNVGEFSAFLVLFLDSWRLSSKKCRHKSFNR
jgi:hypothetical protein